jgi:hypothetical protein
MAIITINVNSNYSAIKASLANGDTIRIGTNAVRLTIDEQPLLTNITVDSPGVAGKMTVSGGYDLSTWSVFAGPDTVSSFIDSLPIGSTLGLIQAASSGASPGITTNNGTVKVCRAGAAFCSGININLGIVEEAYGGTSSSSHGIIGNRGEVFYAIGGTASTAHGVNTNTVQDTAQAGLIHFCIGGTFGLGCNVNNGTVLTSQGGVGGNAHGTATNNGYVVHAIGSIASSANGVVASSAAAIYKITDNIGKALLQNVGQMRGNTMFVSGPDLKGQVPDTVKTIYSVGKLDPLAVIPVGTVVILLSEGSGSGGFPLSRVLN